MSYPIETIHQFINLRAQGRSLGHLAIQLDIPRSTLGDWNKLHREEIDLQRAMKWEQCEASSQLAREKDLVRLTLLIHKCQDELDRRSVARFSNSELLRLLFSARRDYFKRRDPLVAPLERTHRGEGGSKAADSLKLVTPNKPDKTGQKPDTAPNHRNGNNLHNAPPSAACQKTTDTPLPCDRDQAHPSNCFSSLPSADAPPNRGRFPVENIVSNAYKSSE
jgi:hypothetical protein